jgi:hypothetical protein
MQLKVHLVWGRAQSVDQLTKGGVGTGSFEPIQQGLDAFLKEFQYFKAHKITKVARKWFIFALIGL